MKILHIINNLNKGGAERLLVDVLPHYVAAGHQVALLQISHAASAPEYIDELSQKGVKVSSLGAGNLYNPSHIPKLKKWIVAQQPDIVHAHLFPTMYWVAAAARLGLQVPIVFTEHSTQNNRFNKPYLRSLDRKVYSSFQKIIAISPAILSKLSTWIGSDQKLTLIRNGVDTQRYIAAKPYTPQELHATFGSNADKYICLMTARFAYPKNHKLVIDALQQLPQSHSVAFAGVGGLLEEAKAYAQSTGVAARVDFLGFRTDIPRLMKSVSCNILSSAYEGMSGVACEALAAGRPFLGSDVPGINDVVPDHRFLFAAGDSAQLAEKILYNAAHAADTAQLVADGLARAHSFDIKVMVEKHLSLYRELIA